MLYSHIFINGGVMDISQLVSGVSDDRGNNKRYDAGLAVISVILAYLCGRDSVDGAHRNRRFVPCRAQLHNILSHIDADDLEKRLSNLVVIEKGHQLCIDGKRLRASRVGKQRGVHLIEAFCQELHAVIDQEEMMAGENEVEPALRLLSQLDLRDKIVTGDAMFTQPEVVQEITESKGDYVLAVKDNQYALKRKIVASFDAEEEAELSP
jgi:hypothetical protein